MDLPHYTARSRDLARFLAEPADDAIAAEVTAAVASGSARRRFRDTTTEAEIDDLLLFARRRAASALRERKVALAREAVDALTLVSIEKIDPRDLSVDFPLLAEQQLGGDGREVALQAASESEPRTAEYFLARADRARTLTLADCALLEVRTKYGLGFIDVWTSNYAPRADLAGEVVRIADEIDRQGRYETEPPHCSDLPAVWFGLQVKGAPHLPARGCVSVTAHLHGSHRWGPSLLMFLAELGNRSEAQRLAEAANRSSSEDRPRAAIARNEQLLLAIGGSFTRGEKAVEDDPSLRTLAASLLSDETDGRQ